MEGFSLILAPSAPHPCDLWRFRQVKHLKGVAYRKLEEVLIFGFVLVPGYKVRVKLIINPVQLWVGI